MTEKYPPGIMINKATMDRLKDEERPGDLLALYGWYCYTASWQETNVVWANVSYMSELTKWSVEKVRRIRKKLKELDLIEDVQKRVDGNKLGKRYVIVKYISVLRKNRRQGNQSAMCLDINSKVLNINKSLKDQPAKRAGMPLLGDYKDFATRYGMKIQAKLNIHTTIKKNGRIIKHQPVKATTWAREIVYILHTMRVHKDIFKAVMKWYFTEGLGKKYTPRIRKVKDLVEKWPSIVDAMTQYQQEEGTSSRVKYRKGVDGQYGWYED
jgi:hypothetical protein